MNPNRTLLLSTLILALAASLRAGEVTVFDADSVFRRDVVAAAGRRPRLTSLTETLEGTSSLRALSPRGRSVLIVNDPGPLDGRAELYVASPNGRRLSLLSGGLDGGPLAAAFSPRGKLLLFEHRDIADDRSDLYLADSRGRVRTAATAGLPGTASDEGGRTVISFGERRDASFLWSGPGGRQLWRGDPADPASLRDLAAGLPAGEVRSDPVYAGRGLLLFTHLPAGAQRFRLYGHREGAPELLADELVGWSTDGELLATIRHDLGEDTVRLRAVTGRRRDLDVAATPGGFVLATALLPDALAVAWQAAAGGGIHLGLLRKAGWTDVPLGLFPEQIHELRRVGDRGLVALRLTAAGGARLLVVDTAGGGVRDAAVGLPGEPIAIETVSPGAPVLVFRLLDPDERLYAWIPGAGARDLGAGAGIDGPPGSAAILPRRGDVLFTVREGPDRIARLVRWESRRDRFTILSPPGFRVGSFFATR